MKRSPMPPRRTRLASSGITPGKRLAKINVARQAKRRKQYAAKLAKARQGQGYAVSLAGIAELLDAIEACERHKWASGGGHVAFGKYQWQQVMAHALTLRARLREFAATPTEGAKDA